jgi:two-component system chemotaxis response regulator CheB
VVIAASAGALPAIIDVLAPLPSNFPAAIAIVQHRGEAEPDVLVRLLAQHTRLRVCHARDGATLEPGTVYVCPPRVHMTTEHCVRLIDGPRIQFVQPSADLMFESVGRAYGNRAIGVVLSGCGSDAALGTLAIAQAGGRVIAQAPQTCGFSGMPESAMKTGAVEQVMTPAEIAMTLHRWVDDHAIPKPAAAGSIRVLLVDDHQIVLDGLRVLLEGEPDVTVVARAGDGETAVRLAAELAPDVVVMDIRMAGLDGVEAMQRILADRLKTRVVALSSETDRRTVDRAFRAGATGYLSKHRAFGELAQAIRAVSQGKVYLSPEIARLAIQGSIVPPLHG